MKQVFYFFSCFPDENRLKSYDLRKEFNDPVPIKNITLGQALHKIINFFAVESTF